MTNITNDHVQIFKGLDAFVEVACPRIAIDDHFDKPMLSTPQAFALIKLLKNEPIEDLLKIHHLALVCLEHQKALNGRPTYNYHSRQ